MSGRLLVGLRWWNEVSETGGSDWKFESLEEGQRGINKKDSFVFWTVLYVTPVVWGVLGFIALLKVNLEYLLLVIIAFLLSAANLLGYIKCGARSQVPHQAMLWGSRGAEVPDRTKASPG